MPGFRFGVFGMGRNRNARLRLPEGLLRPRGDGRSPAWTVRLIQPKNDLQLRCGDHTASGTRLGHREQDVNAARDHPGERMVADTKSISTIYRSRSKFTPVTRPSRFSSRQISRPLQRNAAASPFSTSHGTCSARRLARLLGVRQRAASKTAWIGNGRLGSSAQKVWDGASRDPSTVPPRWP